MDKDNLGTADRILNVIYDSEYITNPTKEDAEFLYLASIAKSLNRIANALEGK